MKKNKLYLIFSITIVLILFGTAATCNLCGITPNADTGATSTEKSNIASKDTQEQKNTEETKADEEETKSSESEETNKS